MQPSNRILRYDRASHPSLSVVFVAADRTTTATMLRYLRAQSVKDRLEPVIVTSSQAALGLSDPDLEGLRYVQVVEGVALGVAGSIARATAIGIRAASTPIVVLIDNHCFPAPGWADALLAAHHQGWEAVGFAIGNANPRHITWADHFSHYGRWFAPEKASEVEVLPVQNCSYRRSILMDPHDDLGKLLDRFGTLHEVLRNRGYRFYVEPAAEAQHLHVSKLRPWISVRFSVGRLYADRRMRSERWSLLRRLIYIVAAPVFPAIYMRQIFPEAWRTRRRQRLSVGLLATMVFGFLVQAAGEAAGYAWGPGRSDEALTAADLYRFQYVSDAEIDAVTAGAVVREAG